MLYEIQISKRFRTFILMDGYEKVKSAIFLLKNKIHKCQKPKNLEFKKLQIHKNIIIEKIIFVPKKAELLEIETIDGKKIKKILKKPRLALLKKLKQNLKKLKQNLKNLKQNLKNLFSPSRQDFFGFSKFLSMPFFLPILNLIIFLTKSFYIIKFKLNKKSILIPAPAPHRLGHALSNVDIGIHEILKNLHGIKNNIIVFFKNVDIIYDLGPYQFKKPFYLKEFNKGLLSPKNVRILFLFGSPMKLLILEKAIKKAQGTIFKMRTHGHRDIFGVLENANKFYCLPKQTERNAKEILWKKGFKMDQETILISYRESGNIKSKNTNDDARRYNFRNCSVLNYKPAIQYLLKKYNVVRVGLSKEKLHFDSENFYDLTSQNESAEHCEILFYLFSICKFFIGTTSGIYSIAQLMRKPILWTNMVPIGHYSCWNDKDINIFKLQRKKNGNLYKISDTLKTEAGWMLHQDKVKSKILFRENTADEILEAVIEMENKIKIGKMRKTNNSKLFINMLPNLNALYGRHKASVSEYFLTKHKKLFA